MNLKNFLLDNWEKSKFIKISLNKDIKKLIENETLFLSNYYNKISLRTRAYVIINSITENSIPKCECGCGKVSAINNTYPELGFRQYSGPDCSRSRIKINKNSAKNLENYSWLYDQRIIQKKSILQIAEELQISTIPVVKYLKIHKIDKLIDGRRRNSLSVKILSDKTKLQSYYNSGLTCEKIGELLGVSKSTVSKWLNVHEIEIKPANSYERKIKKISREEESLVKFIESIYTKEIKQSNRSILNGKELDIYLPEDNLAIEYNGLYSHSYKPSESRECLVKDSGYHISKTKQCEEKGIQLLQFYSDEWLYKQEIVKSIIKSKLNLNKKIYARNCQKIIVSTTDKNLFLNENHIQGEDKSRIKLGLIYDNKLVCVMTFCKSRFNKNYQWELSRFCTKKEYTIVGGFSRLLTWFRENNSGNIISYADRRYSNGDVYLKNGFKLIKINPPSYYYTDKNYLHRYNRMGFQKKYTKATGTEYEKALEMGYNKIFDCGTIGFGLQ